MNRKGRAHRGLGPEHFPCLTATAFVTPSPNAQRARCYFFAPQSRNRGAGVSGATDHEWPAAAGAAAGKGAGAEAGAGETGPAGSHGAGEYSFA